MVKGVSGSRSGTGSVTRTCRRSGVTGRSTPAQEPISADQAPAAQTTVSVRMVPASVRTPTTRPSRTSMPVAAQCGSSVAPARRAADA